MNTEAAHIGPWRKSSYSSGQGGNCVEVAPAWRKSSHSSGQGGDCVEMASLPTTIAIRDSKLPSSSPFLTSSPTSWTSLLATLR